ncbi:M15 family metallopeptidase [Pseudohongiella sp.]|uniref:Peptidase M15B domain-containing protein n=1 Tax=marine sediment metagenome TaxID=412755 RepID=A0A0F9VH08_9ZZZZ|nr:M15 family metallopeptidase [Pseudohongiella sp.]
MNIRPVLGAAAAMLLTHCTSLAVDQGLPAGFSSLALVDDTIELDMRYLEANNFVGEPITGYQASACVLTTSAASALAEVQAQANLQGYSLKVYDCFRPQRAVNHFVAWAADADDNRMKARFYPDVPKNELFSRGYIAERSGHSRGSTVDLTLVPLGSTQPLADPMGNYDCRGDQARRFPDNSLDMGTGYDCFDALSHTDNPDVGAQALANRHLLRELMNAAGFVNYDQEWWHYTLREEPFTDQYFDFPIQ